MRLALLASVALSSSLASPALARGNISVFASGGPTNTASWDVVSPDGCTQRLTFIVNSARFLSIDTATRTVVKERFDPALTLIVDQFDSPGCELVTLSTQVDHLTAAQYKRNGLASAQLNVHDVVLSDPLVGTIVVDAKVNWTGTGKTTTTPIRERFCDAGTCVTVVGVLQNRAAKLSGSDVDATVTTNEGGVSVENYSPSAGANVFGNLEQVGTVIITRTP